MAKTWQDTVASNPSSPTNANNVLNSMHTQALTLTGWSIGNSDLASAAGYFELYDDTSDLAILVAISDNSTLIHANNRGASQPGTGVTFGICPEGQNVATSFATPYGATASYTGGSARWDGLWDLSTVASSYNSHRMIACADTLIMDISTGGGRKIMFLGDIIKGLTGNKETGGQVWGLLGCGVSSAYFTTTWATDTAGSLLEDNNNTGFFKRYYKPGTSTFTWWKRRYRQVASPATSLALDGKETFGEIELVDTSSGQTIGALNQIRVGPDRANAIGVLVSGTPVAYTLSASASAVDAFYMTNDDNL